MAWQWIGFGRRQELPESLSWEVNRSPLLTLWQSEERERNRELWGVHAMCGLAPQCRQAGQRAICL